MINSRRDLFDLRPSSTRYPVRALLCSLLLHTAAVAIILWIGPIDWWPAFRADEVTLEEKIDPEKYVLTMPSLGQTASGSKAGAGESGGSAKQAGAKSPEVAARPKSIAGLIFQGPQPIVSSPSKPDNFLQTIRMPDIPQPPRLTVPITSPNILKMAMSAPQRTVTTNLLDPKAPLMRPSRKIPVRTNASDIAEPKLTVPVSGQSDTKVLSSMVTPATAKVTGPEVAHTAVPSTGQDDRNLLVINAVPAPPTPNATLPAGELSGAFSVSPDPASAANAGAPTNADAPGGTSPSSDAGTAGAGSGKGTAGSGSDKGPVGGQGVGTGGGTGAATGAGPGTGIAGNGPAATGAGPGVGRGSGPGLTAGRGAGKSGDPNGTGGTGSGNPFPDVTIAGGPAHPANTSVRPPRTIPPRQTYGMTIVATSSTGGGLKDYGVFKNEVVYTVYMDMNEADKVRQNWTLQYATITPPGQAPPAADAVLVPPFPIAKPVPELRPEITARNVGRMIVAAGVITKEGKFGSLRIVQSPNPLMIEPALACLAKWTFEAAELNGEPIAVKVVVGIPISLDLASSSQ